MSVRFSASCWWLVTAALAVVFASLGDAEGCIRVAYFSKDGQTENFSPGEPFTFLAP